MRPFGVESHPLTHPSGDTTHIHVIHPLSLTIHCCRAAKEQGDSEQVRLLQRQCAELTSEVERSAEAAASAAAVAADLRTQVHFAC